MKKTWKKKWISALLSGKYLRGTGALVGKDYSIHNSKDYTVYCCLGVLCKVSKMTDKQIQRVVVIDKNKEESDNELLSPKLLTKFGLSDRQQKKLAAMNDEEDGSFEKIAKYVQRYL